MPDRPGSKHHEHPRQAAYAAEPAAPRLAPLADAAEYAELHCLSNFSFLRGASHPEELIERAAELGYAAIAITDRESLAGVVRAHIAHRALRERGGDVPRLIIGAEILPRDGPPLVLLATDRAAYGRLCRLITRGRRRARKGDCELWLADVIEYAEGLIAIVRLDESAPRALDAFWRALPALRSAWRARLYLAASLDGQEPDATRLARFADLAREAALPLTATNHVHYHVPQRRYLQDVLTCVREKCTLAEAGRRLWSNAERHLRARDELQRRYTRHADVDVAHAGRAALQNTLAIADQCCFSLDELRYDYPHELVPPGRGAMDYLEQLTWAGAAERYGAALPEGLCDLVRRELGLIRELRYEHYFLTVWDLCRFARERGILCQGRGSAANSAVCYCLSITAVDPARHDLLFERFISKERNEPPDIDVDFEHERREEVFQYIYEKYGRERAAITAEVISYRARSAVRDVGKALGLSLDCVDAIAKSLDWFDTWSAEEPPVAPEPAESPADWRRRRSSALRSLRNAGVDPRARPIRMLIRLVRQILGFPRHLSQHVGGFVITHSPLCELVPLENGAMPGRTFIEWDKDDIDALGILKVDCLALGMLTAIRKCLQLLPDDAQAARRGITGRVPRALVEIPAEDPHVYDRICEADTVGVFQIESRAQMSMLPRLRPRNFYDLVIEVAIVRPGPIQGGMVHPFLRRRSGLEPVSYPSPDVARVLHKTLGVPIFQEQAMRLAVVAAGFTPGEADQLRRAMAAWRRGGQIEKFERKLIAGMLERGYTREFAEQLYKQIQGFGEYGFPESHAASFALLVYASSWLKTYYPAEFCAAMLNAQPLGFYTPGQLLRDAQEHGVEVRSVDVGFSEWDCTLEPRADGHAAVRLGLRLVRGLSAARLPAVRAIAAAQRAAGAAGLHALWRAGVGRASLLRLAAADAFGSLHLDRRTALWHILALDERAANERRPRAAAPALRLVSTEDALPPSHETDAPAERAPLPRGRPVQSLLFADQPLPEAPRVPLPEVQLEETVVADYDAQGFSLHAHPLALLRPQLEFVARAAGDTNPLLTCAALRSAAAGRRVAVAGLVTLRQRPGTAKGVVFMTLEDETGMANLIIRPNIWEQYWSIARNRPALLAAGRVERQGQVVHLMAERFFDLTMGFGALRNASRDFH